jgi:phage tail sheath protein FI
MALLDTPPLDPSLGPEPLLNPDEVLDWRTAFDTKYAAFYYPWILVPNPLSPNEDLLAVPPSGHLAGVYARVEAVYGPHKPPANEVLERAEDLTTVLDDVALGRLNERGINALRVMPARGIRVAGARTLTNDPQWMYVNVRRLIFSVERLIEAYSQWIPFEPHNLGLRVEIDRVVRGLLDGLWRRGMLDGAKAADAYYVRCDSTTNTDADTNAGRVICEVGLQSPWPAEFVVIRVGKTEGGTQILETTGVSHA